MTWALVALTIFASLGGAAFFASRSAFHKVRARFARASLDHAREANEIEEEVDRLSDFDIDERLHDTFRD
jgi:hypothetical protein